MTSAATSTDGVVEATSDTAPDEAAIGRVLRLARTRRQWSVREVARRTGFGNTYLSQIERGVIRKPDPTALWQLASLYNLDFGLLLEWSGQAGRDRQVFFDAMKAFTALDPERQTEALAYLRSLGHPQREPENRSPTFTRASLRPGCDTQPTSE